MEARTVSATDMAPSISVSGRKRKFFPANSGFGDLFATPYLQRIRDPFEALVAHDMAVPVVVLLEEVQIGLMRARG